LSYLWFDINLLPWASWPSVTCRANLQPILDKGIVQIAQGHLLSLSPPQSERPQDISFHECTEAYKGWRNRWFTEAQAAFLVLRQGRCERSRWHWECFQLSGPKFRQQKDTADKEHVEPNYRQRP